MDLEATLRTSCAHKQPSKAVATADTASLVIGIRYLSGIRPHGSCENATRMCYRIAEHCEAGWILFAYLGIKPHTVELMAGRVQCFQAWSEITTDLSQAIAAVFVGFDALLQPETDVFG